ncbi:P-loop containing nucleoside triphosphate hydrolase protein [Aureobasidium melanogenum CBS 110374]|uniref:ATP-dependent RNA helicase n=1 Tax=Aureobasidium melanogenum (strain CBS 110374) TaxID=1043003 RepID=A0A074W2E4_AURM1|nr:P-loop containing nucleoside triphosphate hydrolase protein [Aureobasidium melanogenum CBS 110374]KEQ67275.1 P-loop containing nucleoside triphosphate hydrolase protein [Aureobasidium melanogenum CBS 110374]
MAPYARYVPPKPAALVAADTTADLDVSVPPQQKPVKVPKGPSRSDDNGRKKRKRPDIDNPPTTTTTAHVNNDDEASAIPSKHSAVYSKFQKAAQRSEAARAAAPNDNVDLADQPELHDLIPLPQPERAPTPDFVPSFSSLPQWLAQPIVVSQSTTRPFSDLSLSKKTLAHLEVRGYTTAFAVQAALLPLLLPHPYLTHLPPNDVCVSAPTGSGKTLAYVLPIVENLRTRLDTKLRAVIVVPTRELVAQASAVVSTCAQGSAIQIALAVGNQSVAAEQESLIKKGRTYDPERHRALMEKARKRQCFELDLDLTDIEATMLDDVVRLPNGYVPTYNSAADLLICTPGRLVEHLTATAGFTLDHVEWLVVDEADRLLDQSFQEWVAKVTAALDTPKPLSTPSPETAALRHLMPRRDRYVRKVILSATMTRDISKLSALKLRRPTMIVVKTEAEATLDNEATVAIGAQDFELPTTLSEFAVPVGDGSDKPLFLLELLRSKIFPGSTSRPKKGEEDSSDSDSRMSTSSNPPKVANGPATKTTENSMVLIFTPSTEAAARLHHLLTHIEPSYKATTLLLTKSSTNFNFNTSSPRIIISTDRASRGLDLPLLTHVINYTIPRSLASYVHRVGRTARAGRSGEAWTLFAENEGRWFWNEIARATGINRSTKVERINMKLATEQKEGGEMRNRYVDALEGMKAIVTSKNTKPSKGKSRMGDDVEMNG